MVRLEGLRRGPLSYLKRYTLPLIALGMEALFAGVFMLDPAGTGRAGPAFALLGASFFLYLPAAALARRLPASAGWVIGSAVLFRLTMFGVMPFASDDIYRYLWDGRVQNTGLNPYRYPPESLELAFLRDENYAGINHKAIRTIYPPFSQGVFRLAAALKPDLSSLKLAVLTFDLLSLAILAALLRLRRIPAGALLIYAWNPLVVFEFAASGHCDAIGLSLLLTGLFLAESARPRGALLAWAGSFLAKFTPVLLLPWVFARRTFRGAFWVFAGAILLGYLPYLGGLDPARSLAGLFEGSARYARDWYFNAGLYALASRLIGDGIATKTVLFGGLAAFGFWLARRVESPLPYAGVMIAATLAVSPVVHPWYAVWLVPFLCFYPLWSGVLWSGLVGLSYAVLFVYAKTGVWEIPAWVPWAEYGLVFSILAAELIWARHPAGRTRAAEIPRPAGFELAGRSQ